LAGDVVERYILSMQTIRPIKTMQAVARQIAGRGKTIALVPTMGALHEGHLSLIRRAAKEADVVITTIFVNPAQFGPGEDLEKYPRDPKSDIELVSQTLDRKARTGIVFLPKAEDIYPDDYETWVTVEQLTRTLEEADDQRPRLPDQVYHRADRAGTGRTGDIIP